MNRIKQEEKLQGINYRIIFIVLAVWGIVMSFMIPTWQIPDEYAHLNMISKALCNEQIAEQLYSDMVLDSGRIRQHYDEKMDIDQWRAAMTKTPDYTRVDVMPHGMQISVIKYLPATIGVLVGILLHLPTFWVMELAELVSLASYLAICWLAIKIMPIRKEIMLIFMAFPMSLQQVGSISYDAMLIPVCFLFISFMFHLYYNEQTIGWKQIITALLLLLLIIYIKIPYVFFVLLFLGLPLDKIHLKIGNKEIDEGVIKKWRIPVSILLVILIAVGVYVLRDNYWVSLVIGLAQEWKRTLYLIAMTGRTFWKHLLVSSVGNLGCLDTPIPFFFVIATYLLLLVLTFRNMRSQEYIHRSKKRIAVVLITFFVLALFILFSMVNHTIMMILFGDENSTKTYVINDALYWIPYIGGLQGRYFLPFMPLPFLILGRDKKVQGNTTIKTTTKCNIVVLSFEIIMMVITIITLYQRFWIA